MARSLIKTLTIGAAVALPAAAVLVVANLPANAAVNPGPGFPTQYAAPYIDTSIAPTTIMSDVQSATGQKYFSLAFVIDANGGGCHANWNGDTSVTGGYWSRLELTEIAFSDDAHLMKIIDKIVSRVGRRVDESSPMVDARLADGSRVNAIIPPLALDGPAMSIRRFGSKPLMLEDLIRHGAFPPPLRVWVRRV